MHISVPSGSWSICQNQEPFLLLLVPSGYLAKIVVRASASQFSIHVLNVADFPQNDGHSVALYERNS